MDFGQNRAGGHQRPRRLLAPMWPGNRNFAQKFCMKERGNSLLRRLDYSLGIPATLPCALLRRLDPHKKKRAPAPERVGILCLGGIGDLLLLSALVNGIHKKLPHCAIELITAKANAAASPLIPHLAGHFSAPIQRVGSFLSWLRKRQYDILFDSSPWARIGNILSSLSGAALTVGFRTRKQWRSCGYDTKVDHSAKRHELENFLALGTAIWPDFQGKPRLAIAPQAKAVGSIIYCHMHPAPGPGRQLKEWPFWADLINILAASGHEVCLTGSKADAMANELFLAKHFPNTPQVRSLAGELSLAALAEKLACATAVISVNTGIMHLAALAGAPTIGLHGATNPSRWGPRGPQCLSLLPDRGESAYLNLGFEFPHDARPSMRHLPVSKVLKALAQFRIKTDPQGQP